MEKEQEQTADGSEQTAENCGPKTDNCAATAGDLSQAEIISASERKDQKLRDINTERNNLEAEIAEQPALSVESIDAAIASSLEWQSMSVDGETTTNQNIQSLLNARKELQREEEIESGQRGTVARFNLSNQQF